jgi:hypothetical protein
MCVAADFYEAHKDSTLKDEPQTAVFKDPVRTAL